MEITVKHEQVAPEFDERTPKEDGGNTGEIQDTLLIPVASYLDVEPNDLRIIKTREKLEYIYKVVARGRSYPSDILNALREIKSKLGTPSFGDNWFEKVYRYTRLINEENSVRKEMQQEERNEAGHLV